MAAHSECGLPSRNTGTRLPRDLREQLNGSALSFLKDNKVQYLGIQVSEKTSVNVDVIAKGTSGHGLSSFRREIIR